MIISHHVAHSGLKYLILLSQIPQYRNTGIIDIGHHYGSKSYFEMQDNLGNAM